MRKRQMCAVLLCAASMVYLIFNAKYSLEFAVNGIKFCVGSLIPSLFPFMFLSVLLNNALSGLQIRSLGMISTLCRIPKGSEILLLLGILGGYPIGAKVIADTYHSGNLKKQDAERMLGFCNNAGPSFIFGVIGPLFHSAFISALLWLIQILSAIITGILLKGACANAIAVNNQFRLSVTGALEKSVKSMGIICSWVILFKIIVGFLELGLGAFVSCEVLTVITGFLELTNGCVGLQGIENTGMRFIIATLLLSAGGLCVALQTASSAKGLSIRTYLIGKCIHAFISVVLAFVIQRFAFDPEQRFIDMPLGGVIGIVLVIMTIIFMNYKKTVAFQEKVVYN